MILPPSFCPIDFAWLGLVCEQTLSKTHVDLNVFTKSLKFGGSQTFSVLRKATLCRVRSQFCSTK